MIANDPFIGRQLGDVRIERLIGQGGMAKVYYGWDDRLQRAVALKIIAEQYQADPAFVERFLREARTVASLRHPNILQIYYAGEEDGVSYFVMEYIRGLNLEQLLRQQWQSQRLIPYSEVIRIGRAAGGALDYAHHQGIIHRDIKPSNIILSEDGRVVLADFGLALQSTTSTLGQVFGSPHYIAPEQARNSSLAVPQSDLYALGVVLYEMLTGQVPFEDESPATLAVQHMTQAPPLPSSINPNLNSAIDTVLLKGLSKNPQERYDTAQEMMDAVENALHNAADEVQPATMRVLPAFRPGPSTAAQPPSNPIQIPATIAGAYQNLPADTYPQQGAPSATTDYPVPPLLYEQPLPPAQGSKGPGRFLTCALMVIGLLTLVALMVFALSQSGSLIGLLIPTIPPPAAGVPGSDLSATQTARALALVPPSTTSPLPVPSEIPSNTPPPTPLPAPTQTAALIYDLRLVKSEAKSLFIVNNGQVPFPLSMLQLGNDPTLLQGTAWGIDELKPGSCVAVWEKGGKPPVPKGLKCSLVGANLRIGSKVFWDQTFQLFFNSHPIDTCQEDQDECDFKFSAP